MKMGSKLIALFLILISAAVRVDAGDGSLHPIEDVVSSYSKASGEKVLLDPRVKGRVNLIGQSLSNISFENLSAILSVHSYSSYRSGGYLVIVPSNLIKLHPLDLVEEGGKYHPNQVVRDLILFNKACPADLVPVLRPLVPVTSHFAVITSPRALLITDVYDNTVKLREIIARIESNLDKVKKCTVT